MIDPKNQDFESIIEPKQSIAIKDNDDGNDNFSDYTLNWSSSTRFDGCFDDDNVGENISMSTSQFICIIMSLYIIHILFSSSFKTMIKDCLVFLMFLLFFFNVFY